MSESKAKTFTAVLERDKTRLRWVIAKVPFDVAKAWPQRNRLRVRAEVAGNAFRTSLFPDSSGHGHYLLVNRVMQRAAGVQAGSKLRIRLAPDLDERVAEVPPELARALKGDRRLRPWFDGLVFSRRKDIGGWVLQAKTGEGREQRAARMAEWLLSTLEGEIDPPPLLKAAFQRQPLARTGWEAMTKAQRRNHLLGIFHYQTSEGRVSRAAKAIEDALQVARKMTGTGDA
jgi:uncharacterized protein YdeI (YjbR/CyaY-like superfamily)